MPECRQIIFEFTQLLRRRHTVVTIAVHRSRRNNNTSPRKRSGHNQGETIFMKKLTLAAAALCVALGGTVARAQDAGALLDLLVKKRLITDQEAEEVRSELVKESASTAAGKWKLSAPITELELYADTRLRYEYRGGRLPSQDQFGQDHVNDWYERHRERYRLRVGLRGTLADDWFFGLRLETSASNRSTNVTFGGESSGGPFAKGDDGIFVGQAYFGYTGFPDFKFTGGRMPQPLITTSMLWDDDINPEGLAEQWKHTFTFDLGGGGAEAVQSYGKGGYSKEGKGVVAAAAGEPFKLKLDVFVNTAQYVYDDENPENPIGPSPTLPANTPGGQAGQKIPTGDAFMLAWQAGARLTFPNSVYVQLAPTLYNYTGNGDTFNIHFNGDPGGNQTGINSLLVFDLPAEVGWKLWDLPMRIFGEFADNIEGHDRARAAGHPDHTGQHYAWMIGGAVGQLKAKSDWEIRAWYQYAGQFALDPNLVDSDIYDSRVNERGVAVKAGYMLADAISLNLTWAYAWRVNGSLGTGGNGDIPINPLDQYQIFQADMSVKW
jgi:Putative porin